MYQPQIVQDAFMGLCGFRQTNNPDFPQLSSTLLKTSSNLLIEHSLINIENIDMTARNYSEFNYPAYVNATSYDEGERVRASNNKIYESLADGNVGNEPSASPDDWEEVNLLSLHLEDVMRSSIDQVVERVFEEKKLRKETKTVLESTRAIDAAGTMNDLIVKTGRLVGVRMYLQNANNIAATIERIGVQLSQAQEITIHIYNSSQAERIATVVFDYTNAGSFQWFTPSEPIVLHHLSENYAPSGFFDFMIDEDSLVGQLIDARYNFADVPCSCNPYAYRNWARMSKFITMQAISVEAVDRPMDISNLYDLTKVKQNPGTNFGLNFDVTAKCDLTAFLVAQKSVFASAIRDMVIVKLLDQMKNSTRQNGVDEKTKSLANFALQSRSVGGGGLLDDLNRRLKAVDFEVSALDGVCMPFANKPGVRHSAFGLQY
jgi:hypothetical protein